MLALFSPCFALTWVSVEIRSINLSQNRLLTGLDELKSWLECSQKLSDFSMAGCELLLPQAATLMRAIGGNKNLSQVSVDFEGNMLGKETEEVVKSIKAASILELNVADNRFGAKQLSEFLMLFSNNPLRKLLVGKNLTSDGAELVFSYLPQLIAKMPTLSTLDMSETSPSSALFGFFASLSENGTISELVLNGCKMKDDGASALGNLLLANKKITRIDVRGNRFTWNGWAAIFVALKDNKTLARVDINFEEAEKDRRTLECMHDIMLLVEKNEK